MKDHVVRVANEADFILSKQRAEDVKRHAQFEVRGNSDENAQLLRVFVRSRALIACFCFFVTSQSSCAIFLAQQRDEERQCDSLITAAKHRDHAAALALKNRITNILTNKLGAWGASFNRCAQMFQIVVESSN